MDMISLLAVLSLVLTAVLLGSMVFFSAVVAPLIFTRLEMDAAGRLVRAIFPWYYLLIMVCAGVGGLGLLAALPLNALLLLAVAASATYCRQLLMPQINTFRDRDLDGDKQAGQVFNRLHRRSEVINVLQVLAVLAVFLHLAFFIDVS
jgi:hypothetical protein